jgi:hypothetical protein
LLDLLDDDVLAAAATDALVQLGSATARAIIPRLDAWWVESRWSPRRRLALLRALAVLRRLNVAPDSALESAMLTATHPALRAAAALLMGSVRDGPVAAALVRGAVGCDRTLADACRTALQDADTAGIYESARLALRRNAEPDLYGELKPLSAEQREWLQQRLSAGSRR